MKRLILASMLALILALTALMFGPGETALACHEHQLVTPGTVVDNIARGQTSKSEGEGGFHKWHSNVHTGVPGSKIGNDKGQPGLPNNPVTVTGDAFCN